MNEDSRIIPRQEEGNDHVSTPRTNNDIDEVRDPSTHPINSFEEITSCEMVETSRSARTVREGIAKSQSKKQNIFRFRMTKRLQGDSSSKSCKSDTSAEKEELPWYARKDLRAPEQSKKDAQVMNMVFFDPVEAQRPNKSVKER
jgi:hypothetical protein